MKQIPITIFKAQYSRLLEQVRKTKKPICITRHRKPVVQVFPNCASWIGSLKSSLKIIGDIVSPASDKSDGEVLAIDPIPAGADQTLLC